MNKFRRSAAALAASLLLMTGFSSAICGNSWYSSSHGISTSA